MEEFNFEKLRVYQQGLLFVDRVYLLTNDWPKQEMFGLTDQIRRAVTSIVLNVAEGGSRTKKDFRHFIDMARGSCYETIAILTIAKKRKYLTENEFISCYTECLSISKMLSALKTSLRD